MTQPDKQFDQLVSSLHSIVQRQEAAEEARQSARQTAEDLRVRLKQIEQQLSAVISFQNQIRGGGRAFLAICAGLGALATLFMGAFDLFRK